jgi:hypothetical protein
MHQPVEEETINRTLILKLSNGETVIGDVTKETPNYVELSNPFRIMMIPNGMHMSLTILRWDMTIDFDYPVRVFKSTIVACGKPNETMMMNYNEVVSNGFDSNESEEEESTEKDLETIEDKINELVKQAKGSKLH